MNWVQKSWGREEILENGSYCCKKLVYDKPISSSMHYHVSKHETFVVATGEFELQVGDLDGVPAQTIPLTSGNFFVLVPGTRHRLRCIEPGFIVEASTHDDPTDCVRLIPSET